METLDQNNQPGSGGRHADAPWLPPDSWRGDHPQDGARRSPASGKGQLLVFSPFSSTARPLCAGPCGAAGSGSQALRGLPGQEGVSAYGAVGWAPGSPPHPSAHYCSRVLWQQI